MQGSIQCMEGGAPPDGQCACMHPLTLLLQTETRWSTLGCQYGHQALSARWSIRPPDTLNTATGTQRGGQYGHQTLSIRPPDTHAVRWSIRPPNTLNMATGQYGHQTLSVRWSIRPPDTLSEMVNTATRHSQ